MNMSAPVLTLKGLKPYMRHRGVTNSQLMGATGIPRKRWLVLDSLNARIAEEPWLSEAAAIAHALCMPAIIPLTGASDMRDLDLGQDMRDDFDVWRTGVPLPLSTACRLAIRFELPDPLALHYIDRASPIELQVMQTLASGERTSGRCPWCQAHIVGGAAHFPTCLLNLWLPRTAPLSIIGARPKPRKYGVRRLGDSNKAPGLKATRERLGLTQAQMAASVGMHPNYYARIEQCRDPLTSAAADTICALYKVQLYELLTAPGAENLSGNLTQTDEAGA